jgi:DNA-binding transcriptional LysR family regulator
MELRNLRTFRTVARLLSFNRAAERLHYAQSSISAQIQALEEELDVRLFDRLGRRILLTEAGERLLQYTEKLLELEEETRAEVTRSKEPKGTLTIRIPESFGVHRLPPVIKRFRSRFPKVGLRFITCAHEELQKDLRKGVTDLAFLLADAIQAADLGMEPVGFERIVIVAHPDHPLVERSVVQTRDLEGETILLSRVDCSYRRPFERTLVEAGVEADFSLVFNSVATLKQCVREGVGLTVLPEIAIREEMATGRLVALPWAEGALEVAVLMIWHKERWVSPTLKAFMETTREVLSEDYAP